VRAVDLFAGAGGLGLGLEQAGFNVSLANEIMPVFAESYQTNHPDTRVISGAIQEVSDEMLASLVAVEPIDLVAGGPPCQGFSTVGSKNQDDPRNNLFLEFLRVVDSVKPRFVLFENVAGFRNLYKGVACSETIRRLEALGYETSLGMVDAADYGLPQFRKRTIIFAWRKGECPIQFPAPTHGDDDPMLEPRRSLWSAISDLPEVGPGGTEQAYGSAPQNPYQQQLRAGQNSLTEHNCANYGDKMREILRLIPPGGSIEDIPPALRPASCFKNTYARLVSDRPSPTITRNFGTPSSSRCVHPLQNRALSTREGARLQSFPDSYVFHGSKGMKNLQIGNAVPPLLAERLAEAVARAAAGGSGQLASALAPR